MNDFGVTLQFCLLAAALSLDQMACFQMLFSRPIFSALILGWMFGNIAEAAVIGICFECLFVRSIPLKERAAADPTLATAATLGGMWGAPSTSIEAFHPFLLAPFAAALGLLASFLSKWFDLRLRGVNVSLSHRQHLPGSIQTFAAAVLFAKSFGFYVLTVLAVQGALPKIAQMLGPAVNPAGAMCWGLFVCTCMAFAGVTVIRDKPSAAMWGAGLLAGTALVFLVKWRRLDLALAAAGIYIAFGAALAAVLRSGGIKRGGEGVVNAGAS